jgi:biopolymer transport protein ExbD
MEDKEFSSINVIPLVDIMLVLLTIVLTTATFIVQGAIPVSLPKGGSTTQTTIKSLELVLTKEGKVLYSGKEVSFKELEEILKNLHPSTHINLYADKHASVQSLVSLIDLLKKYGFERLSIRTEALR